MALFGDSSVINSNNSGSPSVSSRYQGLIDANPYRNITYQKSGWQNFLSALGFRTQADAWKENMDIQAREYDAAILQKEYDEQYNNPLSQVERMRTAGLNPDIDGGQSIDSGSAAPLGEDPSTPMQTTGDEGVLMQVANGVMSAFTTAMGIVSSFQGVATKHLQNLLSVEDFATQNFDKFIPFIGESADRIRSDYISDSLEMAKMFSKNNLPRRYRQRFVNTIQGFWNSAPGDADAFKAWTDRISSRRKYSMDSQTLYDEFSDVLYPISKELADLQADIFKLNLEEQKTDASASIKENENREEYADALDADLQARSENVGNDVSLMNSQMLYTVRSHISNIISGLEKTSKEGGLKGSLAQVSMTLISMLQLWISSQGAPSVSRSSSFSNRAGDYSQSRSESMSIGF